VFAGLQIEHEVDQGAFQASSGAEVGGEAGAGELGTTFEIEDTEGRTEVPMSLRLEVEGRGFADLAVAPIVGFTGAFGDGLVGDIGETQLGVAQLFLDLGEALAELFDSHFALRDRGDLLAGIAAFALDEADRSTRLVAFVFEVFDLHQGGTTLGVELLPTDEQIVIDAAQAQELVDASGFVTQECSRQHSRRSVSYGPREIDHRVPLDILNLHQAVSPDLIS